MSEQQRPVNGGSRPVPDPTALTTAQLDRAVGSLREIFDARFTGTDRQLDQIQKQLDHREHAIDAKVSQLRELQGEKFSSIATQFAERDTRTEQTSKDSKVAVDAALQAAKEAVEKQNASSFLAISKSEAATTKAIDQQGLLIQTTTRTLDEKINDLKDRLGSIEGRSRGLGDGWGYLIGAIGVLLGLGSMIVMIVRLGK